MIIYELWPPVFFSFYRKARLTNVKVVSTKSMIHIEFLDVTLHRKAPGKCRSCASVLIRLFVSLFFKQFLIVTTWKYYLTLRVNWYIYIDLRTPIFIFEDHTWITQLKDLCTVKHFVMKEPDSTWILYDKLHAWWLTLSWITTVTLLPSLIARRTVGPETWWRLKLNTF